MPTAAKRKSSTRRQTKKAPRKGRTSAKAPRANAYDELIALVRDANLLASTAQILSWDQETMMPKRGVEHRSKQMAQLAKLSHEMATSPRIGELLQACEEDS